MTGGTPISGNLQMAKFVRPFNDRPDSAVGQTARASYQPRQGQGQGPLPHLVDPWGPNSNFTMVYDMQMGVSINGGTPKKDGFCWEDPIEMDDDWGYPHWWKTPNDYSWCGLETKSSLGPGQAVGADLRTKKLRYLQGPASNSKRKDGTHLELDDITN